MNKKIERAVIILSLVIIIVFFLFFLRNIVVPLVKAQLQRDLDTAHSLLKERGAFGALSITVIEALQMVVIFISAEFVQISAGLTYPLPLAVILCDLGVCLGATIIFILVRTFRFTNEAYEKRKARLERLSAGALNTDKSMMTLMYFLFFMPIVPFGAICYRGSMSKLSYGKYILTVSTGCVPSILTSILMGSAGKLFIARKIPLIYLILVIIACAAALFALVYFFLVKVFFKQNDGTPDSIVHSLLFGLAHLTRSRRQRLAIDEGDLASAEEPFVIMTNHPSFYDFYYLDRLPIQRRTAIVANEYYMRLPFLRRIAVRTGLIPKKLFTSDIRSVAGIMKMLRKGYSVTVFPEGRLSIDGSTYPLAKGTGGFFRRLGKDLVLVHISGAYYSKPKWRKKFFKSDIKVSVVRVIKAAELVTMTDDEVDAAIREAISSKAGDLPLRPYRRHDLADGIEKVLYRCPDCGTLYSLKGRGMTVRCSACGKTRTLDGYYRFDDGKTINDLYSEIATIERREIRETVLETRVHAKVFKPDGKSEKQTGLCRMDAFGFSYASDGGLNFSLEKGKMQALAFSCGEEFELYIGDDLYYFYPDTNPNQTVRWGMLADIAAEETYNE